MLNYEVDPELLDEFVPAGTSLDSFEGKTYASLIGFLFLDTRVLGVPVPFHRNFEEVNLRFYVRRYEGEEVRRGVVFIREIVPKSAIALIARAVYNENYVAMPMSHSDRSNGESRVIEYGWRSGTTPNSLSATFEGEPFIPGPSSLESFITEHYWGYAKQRDGSTVGYEVQHPRWRIWSASDASFRGDIVEIDGPSFVPVLTGTPAFAFVAEGSPITVMRGQPLIV